MQELHFTDGNLFDVDNSSRVIFLLPQSPSIAVPLAAGTGEGGGRRESVSVEAAVPGAVMAGCDDAVSAADNVGTGGLGCSRPALSPPAAASALYLHTATGQGSRRAVPA